MASTHRIWLLAAGAATTVALALPALASADVYCVDITPTTGCDHSGAMYNGSTGLQQAFTDAQSSGIANTVRIGAATYIPADDQGFHYDGGSNALTVLGAGEGSTIISIPTPPSVPGSLTNYHGLDIRGNGSSISGLTVTLPTPADVNNTNQHYIGLQATGEDNTISHVTVNGPVVSINGDAMIVTSGTVSHATVSMPLALALPNLGIWELAGTTHNLVVNDSNVQADYAYESDNQSSGTSTLNRVALHAAFRGVNAVASTVAINDSTINMAPGLTNAAGIAAGYANTGVATTSTVTANALTIFGTANTQRGVYAFAYDNPSGPDTATVSLTNSIVWMSGNSSDLERFADNGNSASINGDYDDYDPLKVVDPGNPGGATGAITVSHPSLVDPVFVSATDQHLQPSSPLIDAGNPVAAAPSETDLDGFPRAIAIKGCPAVRDIGAYEFHANPLDCSPPPPSNPLAGGDTTPPETTIVSHPKAKTTNRRATFTFASSEPGSTFLCSYDGNKYATCTSPYTTPRLKPGVHRFDVLATDAAGNRDQTAATAIWKIKKRRHH